MSYPEPREKTPCTHPDCVVYDLCPYHFWNAKKAECDIWNAWLSRIESEVAFFRKRYEQELKQREYSLKRRLPKK